jgi:hypothetical protein
LKVDSIGRVYCSGPDGIWVMAADGKRIGVMMDPWYKLAGISETGAPVFPLGWTSEAPG